MIAGDPFNVERARFKESVAARGTPREGAAQQAFELAEAAADEVRMPAAVVLPNPSRASQPRTVCLLVAAPRFARRAAPPAARWPCMLHVVVASLRH